MPLDGGFLGEAIRLRPSASYCARPVKNRNGDFMGILFGSEGDISSEDFDTLVTKVRNGQGSGNPEDETPCYFGWATFYAVNPTVTTTYTITSVTDNNGCTVSAPHADLTGAATIDVRTVPGIAVQPVSQTVCEDAVATFTTDAGGTTKQTMTITTTAKAIRSSLPTWRKVFMRIFRSASVVIIFMIGG